MGERRTADPSTSLRSGRDDKFVWGTGLKICLRDGLKASALRVHSSLNLPTGQSATRDDKFVWVTGLKICLRYGLKASALRVHSSLNLPTGQSATRDDKFVWVTGLKICLRYGLKAGALRVHSSLNLPTGQSATRDDKGEGICSAPFPQTKALQVSSKICPDGLRLTCAAHGKTRATVPRFPRPFPRA